MIRTPERRSSLVPALSSRDGCWLVDSTPVDGVACVLWECPAGPAAGLWGVSTGSIGLCSYARPCPGAGDRDSDGDSSLGLGSSGSASLRSCSSTSSTSSRPCPRRGRAVSRTLVTSAGAQACDARDARDAVHRAMMPAGARMAVARLSVENSSAQIGNISNFNGPVTVVVAGGRGRPGDTPPSPPPLPPPPLPRLSDDPDERVSVDTTATILSHSAGRRTPSSRLQKSVVGCRDCRTSLLPLPAFAVAGTALAFMGLLASVVVLVGRGNAGHSADPVCLVTRGVWGARPARSSRPPLVPLWWAVVFHHTETDACLGPEQCAQQVRALQQDHMDARGMDDIEFNFLVGGDGAVYEGRGWDAVGRPLAGWSHESLSVAMIGTFHHRELPAAQADAALRFVEWAVADLERVRTDYKVAGACQFERSDSPGARAMARLAGWQHWWNHTTVGSDCVRAQAHAPTATPATR